MGVAEGFRLRRRRARRVGGNDVVEDREFFRERFRFRFRSVNDQRPFVATGLLHPRRQLGELFLRRLEQEVFVAVVEVVRRANDRNDADFEPAAFDDFKRKRVSVVETVNADVRRREKARRIGRRRRGEGEEEVGREAQFALADSDRVVLHQPERVHRHIEFQLFLNAETDRRLPGVDRDDVPTALFAEVLEEVATAAEPAFHPIHPGATAGFDVTVCQAGEDDRDLRFFPTDEVLAVFLNRVVRRALDVV